MALVEALSSLETILVGGLVTATLVLALWCARQSLAAAASRATGEMAWSVVAVAVLAIVFLVVGFGGAGGI